MHKNENISVLFLHIIVKIIVLHVYLFFVRFAG